MSATSPVIFWIYVCTSPNSSPDISMNLSMDLVSLCWQAKKNNINVAFGSRPYKTQTNRQKCSFHSFARTLCLPNYTHSTSQTRVHIHDILKCSAILNHVFYDTLLIRKVSVLLLSVNYYKNKAFIYKTKDLCTCLSPFSFIVYQNQSALSPWFGWLATAEIAAPSFGQVWSMNRNL